MKKLLSKIDKLPIKEKIEAINEIKKQLHEISPFSKEPVDCVLWVPCETVTANDYNPNTVAPPEMKLLETSIHNDGYTQPIVAWDNGKHIEFIDGFHRNRVGKECKEVRERLNGYLPVSIIKQDREGRNDRIASTIRHNRARGKHKVESMSDIIVELKNRNWTNDRISRELGMEPDEILRLCQITGLASLFKDEEFSKSWDIKDSLPDDEFVPLTDYVSEEEKEEKGFRTVNTSDENRIFHTFEKWECYKAGFYNTHKDGMTQEECEAEYCRFLSNDVEFRNALKRVITEWKFSCEHYLTNVSMNRIAWLGQAALCIATGIPSTFRSGYNLLTPQQQDIANHTALNYLNSWLRANGRKEVEIGEAMTEKQTQIY